MVSQSVWGNLLNFSLLPLDRKKSEHTLPCPHKEMRATVSPRLCVRGKQRDTEHVVVKSLTPKSEFAFWGVPCPGVRLWVASSPVPSFTSSICKGTRLRGTVKIRRGNSAPLAQCLAPDKQLGSLSAAHFCGEYDERLSDSRGGPWQEAPARAPVP